MPNRNAGRQPFLAAAVQPDEPEVRATDPMPKGYRLVPKGDVYITKNCRKKTHEAGKTLYVVVDRKNKPIGLGCPSHIYHAVMNEHRATAAQRAEAVRKRDTAIEETFEDAVLKVFPRIPKAEVPQIVKHALKKHSRRVGRTSTVALHDRVKLAVRAHIRHVHTDYDALLQQGVSRPVAREKIWDRLNEVARQWGGRPLKQVAAKRAQVARGETVMMVGAAPAWKAKKAAAAATQRGVLTRRTRVATWKPVTSATGLAPWVAPRAASELDRLADDGEALGAVFSSDEDTSDDGSDYSDGGD